MGSLNSLTMRQKLTKTQKNVLIGTVLGDATIEKNGKHSRLRISQKSANKDYVFWKYNVFKEFCSKKPILESRVDKRTGKISKQWKFSTCSLPVFDNYQVQFYGSGKKSITKEILSSITSPLTLAVWYMDDGHKREDCKALRLNTQCFSRNENVLLAEHLRKKFKVLARLHKVKKAMFCLYIPARASKHFLSLVQKYMVNSMEYKA